MFGFECSFGFSLAVSFSVYLVAFYRFEVYGRAVTLFIAQFVQSKVNCSSKKPLRNVWVSFVFNTN